ncbi:DUF1330 domain-containing protein [Caldimonas sp. KR1-144]|uniref:DUF1330 domain-containing protein n=1 Tax=Caldimonas sp. KR1-144 TaxID=3400911 RepID=UPI003C1022E8
MSKGYWVTWYHAIDDPAVHERYAAAATAAIEAFGGRFLTRGLAVASFEGHGKGPQRCVVVEFDSAAMAVAAYESAAYRAALALLGSSADREVRILQGTEIPGSPE